LSIERLPVEKFSLQYRTNLVKIFILEPIIEAVYNQTVRRCTNMCW